MPNGRFFVFPNILFLHICLTYKNEPSERVMKSFSVFSSISGRTLFMYVFKSLFKFCSVTFLSPPVSPFPQPNRT